MQPDATYFSWTISNLHWLSVICSVSHFYEFVIRVQSRSLVCLSTHSTLISHDDLISTTSAWPHHFHPVTWCFGINLIRHGCQWGCYREDNIIVLFWLSEKSFLKWVGQRPGARVSKIVNSAATKFRPIWLVSFRQARAKFGRLPNCHNFLGIDWPDKFSAMTSHQADDFVKHMW